MERAALAGVDPDELEEYESNLDTVGMDEDWLDTQIPAGKNVLAVKTNQDGPTRIVVFGNINAPGMQQPQGESEA